MDIESSVVRRAAIHAALADPARVRIVDHLSLGDATSTELQALLAMPSNLIAHHLGTLQRAGLVTRHRSEADRRRSYLRLSPESLGGLLPHGSRAVSRVVFVCTANSARSQLAAALWAQISEVPVASAGTRPAERVAPGAVAAAARHDLRLLDSPPRELVNVVSPDDFLVTVCDNAHEELASSESVASVHWSIADPVRVGTPHAFDAAYDELSARIHHLYPRLTAS
jgi:ArsR family transcriptional regulator, arsenate/arsenite/antimonite-responsive transcriptional repressor / arsenate reductase (thioredoxin)